MEYVELREMKNNECCTWKERIRGVQHLEKIPHQYLRLFLKFFQQVLGQNHEYLGHTDLKFESIKYMMKLILRTTKLVDDHVKNSYFYIFFLIFQRDKILGDKNFHQYEARKFSDCVLVYHFNSL